MGAVPSVEGGGAGEEGGGETEEGRVRCVEVEVAEEEAFKKAGEGRGLDG